MTDSVPDSPRSGDDRRREVLLRTGFGRQSRSPAGAAAAGAVTGRPSSSAASA